MATPQRLIAQDVFAFLTPKQVDAISNAATAIALHAGEAVYRQGGRAESIYVVLEGQVELYLPGKHGVTIPIETVGKGDFFGSSATFEPGSYMVTAQCATDCKLLKIETTVLQRLMDQDCRMGYALQRRISTIYFKRYVETMQKLQAIVMTIPLEVHG